SCEEDNDYQIITGIELNGANESDQHATVAMVQQLSDSGLKPEELLADTNYGSGQNIIECAEMGVDLQAPVQDPDATVTPDPWEKPVEATRGADLGEPSSLLPQPEPRAEAFGLEAFKFTDTFDEVIECPGGHSPLEQHLDSARRMIFATFSAAACDDCPLGQLCITRSNRGGERTLRNGRATAATAHRQALQETSEFKDGYKKRSGVESTNAELKGRHGARNLRVRGRKRNGIRLVN
ncbi:MAG: transposase, partial [Anaerolineales bacterium]